MHKVGLKYRICMSIIHCNLIEMLKEDSFDDCHSPIMSFQIYKILILDVLGKNLRKDKKKKHIY